ncbi:MAG: hypothetical protein AB7V62_00710 [Thermoleophilia bacterium]
MRTRRALASASLAALLLVPAAGSAAPSPDLAGTWSWRDHDESLTDGRNARTGVVTVHGDAATLRLGRGPARRLAVARNGRSFTVVVTRRAGRRGEDRVRVRYRGRLTTGPEGARLAGDLTILSPRYPGRSAFSAIRRG